MLVRGRRLERGDEEVCGGKLHTMSGGGRKSEEKVIAGCTLWERRVEESGDHMVLRQQLVVVS